MIETVEWNGMGISMKKEITNCPEKLKEEYGFSWMEHVLAIPSPLVTVTTYKKNGLPNATMQSWCTFVGDSGYHVIFGSVNRNGHMYTSCKETGCCVVNIPSKEVFLKCIATIENNGWMNVFLMRINKGDMVITAIFIIFILHKIRRPVKNMKHM